MLVSKDGVVEAVHVGSARHIGASLRGELDRLLAVDDGPAP
ncbi:MAG: hypothetical protein ACOC46_02045 [Pirellulales bacterium]